MGLMDFVGNAALTGNAMMGRQNEIDAKGAEQERLARIQDELQAARERTRLEMAQEMREAADIRAEDRGLANRAKERQTITAEGIANEDAQRQRGVERINTARTGLINSDLDRKYASAKPADPSTWTPEMQSAVDQSREIDANAMKEDQSILKRAAIKTGDLSIKDVLGDDAKYAKLANDLQMKQLMADVQSAKNAGQYEVATAKLEAALAKAQSGGEGKALTEGQSKALLFGSRMREADKIMEDLSSEGKTTSVPGSMNTRMITAMTPEKNQMLVQAKRDFMSAVLRRESGAVISDSEFDSADKQYFPQIGDSAKVIQQKTANRKLAIDGVLAEVPENRRGSVQPRADNKPKLVAPKNVASIEDEMRRRGLIQ